MVEIPIPRPPRLGKRFGIVLVIILVIIALIVMTIYIVNNEYSKVIESAKESAKIEGENTGMIKTFNTVYAFEFFELNNRTLFSPNGCISYVNQLVQSQGG